MPNPNPKILLTLTLNESLIKARDKGLSNTGDAEEGGLVRQALARTAEAARNERGQLDPKDYVAAKFKF